MTCQIERSVKHTSAVDAQTQPAMRARYSIALKKTINHEGHEAQEDYEGQLADGNVCFQSFICLMCFVSFVFHFCDVSESFSA